MSTINNATRKTHTHAADNATGRRFCNGCKVFMPLDGGRRLANRFRPRWFCAECVAFRTQLQKRTT